MNPNTLIVEPPRLYESLEAWEAYLTRLKSLPLDDLTESMIDITEHTIALKKGEISVEDDEELRTDIEAIFSK